MTINPNNLTNYSWNDDELEEFWIFSICVAGKNADTTTKVVEKLLKGRGDLSPFAYIASLTRIRRLEQRLRKARTGQYKRITRALSESLPLMHKLNSCSIDDLESIFGVGMKTSRFFLLHTRRNIEVAVLDTHILKFLRDKGYDAPKNTPSKSAYRKWEEIYLEEAKKFDIPLADLDLLLWKIYSNRI